MAQWTPDPMSSLAQPLVPRVALSRNATSGLTTDTGDALIEPMRRAGGLAAALIIRSVAGTAPSITGKIQHSPSPASVADATAVWKDLLTFAAQTGTGADVQQVATPYFPRLRAQVIRGGTAVSELSYDVVIV